MIHWKYLQYVLRHKWYVFLACLRYGLIWQGITHDWSKFLPSEWLPYAKYFYEHFDYQTYDQAPKYLAGLGIDPFPYTKQYWKERFDEAWNHHQKRQPHHWQYWVLMNDSGSIEALDMPLNYCREMIADWRGAGRAITGKDDTKNWYLKNREKMKLHPNTRAWVERELGIVEHDYQA